MENQGSNIWMLIQLAACSWVIVGALVFLFLQLLPTPFVKKFHFPLKVILVLLGLPMVPLLYFADGLEKLAKMIGRALGRAND